MPHTVLAIDDEPQNLDIINMFLEEGGYEIIQATGGVEGLELLRDNQERIDVVLLDRMMPNLNGMEFMQKVKLDDKLREIPVIMQTAAAQPKEISEGIESGVYYYLPKPFGQDLLLSLIYAAIRDYRERKNLKSQVNRYKSKIHLVKESYFEVMTINDCHCLSTFLANFYPDPERVILGIAEMLINAVEHGNLGITYEFKSKLTKDQDWHEEIEKRLAMDCNKNKKVLVHFYKDKDAICLNIKDQGAGFDWKKYMQVRPERLMHNHGRGISIASAASFDEVQYNDKGNEVTCKIFV